MNASKLALAGESKTTSPDFAFFLAVFTASSKFSQWIIFILLFSVFASNVAFSIIGAVGPVKIKVPTFSAIFLPISV